MKVYCTHTLAKYFKASNFYRCPLCTQQWYGTDDAPLVVIGETDSYKVGPDGVPLPKKRMKRCSWCKDVIQDRHWLCEVRIFLDKITVGPAPEKRR